MRRLGLWCLGVGAGLILVTAPGVRAVADDPATGAGSLVLAAGQADYLSLEPILVRVELKGSAARGLPPAPGKGESGALKFLVEPQVKPRANARALPEEARNAGAGVQARKYDLLEWFQFPDKGGTWTVRAAFEEGGNTVLSAPVSVTIRTPEPTDADFAAMTRLHHIPWSNYETNAFCGDTFDVVKKWPDSRFAKYCHYWSARYSQQQKDYDKAVASYRAMLASAPDFLLADDARRGIEACEQARNAAQ